MSYIAQLAQQHREEHPIARAKIDAYERKKREEAERVRYAEELVLVEQLIKAAAGNGMSSFTMDRPVCDRLYEELSQQYSLTVCDAGLCEYKAVWNLK